MIGAHLFDEFFRRDTDRLPLHDVSTKFIRAATLSVFHVEKRSQASRHNAFVVYVVAS